MSQHKEDTKILIDMACNNCETLDAIPECSDSLELGTIDADTEVYIYVKNNFTGYIHKQNAVSGLYGALTLDLTLPDPSFYNKDSNYEVWATLRDDNERIDITVSYGIVADCVSPQFFLVNDFLDE
jgi:hypothetical protein